MPDVDFTSAYRDATKGSTLKALAARRAEMQAALATARPREVKSPEQAIASVADTISGSIREGRLANQEAQGRARFAQLLAGGLTPDEAGEAYGLDAETTQKWMDRNWAQEDAKKTAADRKAELEQGHSWDVEAASARVQAEQDAARAAAEDAQKKQDDQQAAATTLADHNATIEQKQHAQEILDNAELEKTKVANARETSRLEREGAAEITAAEPQTGAAKLAADLKAGRIDQATYDAAMEKETHIPQSAATNQDRTALWKQQDEYANTTSTLGQLKEAKDLLTQGINWGRVMGPVNTTLGSAGVGSAEDQEQAQRTNRYNSIIGEQALLSLAATLKGASSDKDVAIFMDIMNNPATDPTRKAQAIDDMMARVSSHQELQRTRILELGGNLPAEEAKPDPDEEAQSLDNARKKIAASPELADLVKKRLVEAGIDPGKL
jgi:hypothetical protein